MTQCVSYVVLAIACNKMDVSEEPMASERFAHIVDYAHSSNVPLFRTSAKFNHGMRSPYLLVVKLVWECCLMVSIGIEEMFHDVSQRVLYNYLARKKIENSENVIRPTAGSSGICPGCSDGRAVWGCCWMLTLALNGSRLERVWFALQMCVFTHVQKLECNFRAQRWVACVYTHI